MASTNDTGLVLRTARKEHECHGSGGRPNRHADTCAGTIEPTQRYVEVMWEAPAFASGSRVSMECARAFYGWRD